MDEIIAALGEDRVKNRWELGIEHHPKAVEIVNFLSVLDYEVFNDSFCWKMGGDGDNGEALAEQLSIYFEYQESQL